MAPFSEAEASLVGSGGTLGDFFGSLDGRDVATAVVAPIAASLALAILHPGDGEQVCLEVPIAKRMRHLCLSIPSLETQNSRVLG